MVGVCWLVPCVFLTSGMVVCWCFRGGGLSLSLPLSLSLSLSLCLSVCLSLSLCVCRNLDKAEPKYKSKAPLAYVQGTTKFYTEAIAKSKIVVTEGDAMQT